MPYQKEGEIVIAMWRDVERRLAEPGLEDAEAEHLRIEAARLRDEYRRLVQAARDHHRPEPPPLP